jgi:DHA1 family multidrug resistance protein-like MFS transporter
MGRGRTLPPPFLSLDDYVVDFDEPDDPDHPYNWKFPVKYAGFSPPLF